MAAIAESLTVVIVRVRTQKHRRKPMLVVGCTDPGVYPLSEDLLRRLKHTVARVHGVEDQNLAELDFEHESFKPVRIPLVGLFFEEYEHLANCTHCHLINKTRQALGLGSTHEIRQASRPAASARNSDRQVVKRAPSMAH